MQPESTPSLLSGLRAALQRWGDVPLEPLADRGLAHHHVRLAGRGLLARIPKQSQVGLPPQANLRHQQACFERCGPSAHTPRLHGVLPVGPGLPQGALLVEEVRGRAPELPRDLPAIATALAAVHALELPPRGARAPLPDAADPLRQLHDEIAAQARHLEAAALPDDVRTAIRAELHALERRSGQPGRPDRRLIAFDAHPGNFLLRTTGQAVLVDLEKCRYSYPGLDLAHASLYTSTTWDVAARAVLSPEDVAAFYRQWERAAGPQVAASARPWQLPLRRAMWLWSVTWCCKWRALSGRPPRAGGGEDWSAANSEPGLVQHVRSRVDEYLSPAAVRFVRAEFGQLERLLVP